MPYVIDGSICSARVMVVGTLHNRDPAHSQYERLERLYRSFAPTLVLHESVTPLRPALTREAAIRSNGEIGFVQFLAAADGVDLRSGDLPETEEFRMLMNAAEPLHLLVSLTGQRLLTGLADEAAASAEYPIFYRDYLVANGLPFDESWSTWEGFRSAYRAVVGADYRPETFDPDLFSPIRNLGPLNRISRFGHLARDQHLLREMTRAAGEGHRRIMVVFGAWHVLALEPVIRSPGTCASMPASVRHPPART